MIIMGNWTSDCYERTIKRR